MARCFHCKAALDDAIKPSLRDECPSCASDVHVCLNCTFYDPGAHNDCREPMAEMVSDRERANHCEYFRLGGDSPGDGGKDEAIKRLKDLFK